jgi:hypothetical protein
LPVIVSPLTVALGESLVPGSPPMTAETRKISD